MNTRILAAVFFLSFVGFGVGRAASIADAKVDRIVVEKSKRQLFLFQGTKVLKVYSIALGRGGTGPKSGAGDNRTPEGIYRIDWRNSQSQYYRSLHISYPNEDDTKRAKSKGLAPGGDIMVHGIKNGFGWLGPLHRIMNWTRGCIAVTNNEIDEIWQLVPDGTPIEIRR